MFDSWEEMIAAQRRENRSRMRRARDLAMMTKAPVDDVLCGILLLEAWTYSVGAYMKTFLTKEPELTYREAFKKALDADAKTRKPHSIEKEFGVLAQK